MEFPVDLLATVDPEALEQAAKDYMSKLLYRNPEIRESLSLPDSSEVEIGLCNVGFVPLYGCDIKQKILALFSPEDRFKAVGLYLLGQWWAAEDILKTADPSRTGLLEVRTPGERIVLYVLNRIIYRTQEKASDDTHFLCHEEHEIAKILWKDGEAIGFYSVKPEGTLCRSFLTQCYQLPIMDTIYIRKCHRRNGYGLQMLTDFVRSFKTDCLGLKYPLSPAMYKVCKNYLSTYPADKELLWEVDGIGGLFQRTLIARKLQAMELKGDHQVVSRLNFETEHTDVQMEEVRTQVQKTMEYTVEVVLSNIKDPVHHQPPYLVCCGSNIGVKVQDTPVSTRVRSSNLKRKKLGEETGDTAEKIIRVEDIEAGVQSPVEELMPSVVSSSLNVTEANLKEATVTVTHSEEHVLDVTQVHDKEHKEMTVESEECALEVCALTQPTSEPATVTPEEALETTEVFQMTPSAEIQSMKSHKETQVVKSFETTIGLVDLQPLELQQAVEVEVVKMTSGTEEVTGSKGEVEKTVVAVASVVEEAKSSSEEIACLEKPCHQTELDPKPVSMFSEESTTTEIRVLRKSSCRVSTATPPQKSTRLYKELQVASQEDQAAPQQKSIQRSKAVHQEERTEVVEQSENEEDQEMGKEKEKEDVMDIGRDANEACSTQNKDTEKTDVTNEDVVTEEHQVGPLDVVLEGEDIKTNVERIIAEKNREVTSHSVVELSEIQDSEPSEELLEPKTPLDVAGATNEDREIESVEKEKAEIKQKCENVVGGAEEKNENLEIEKDTVDEYEAHKKDTQESISEKEKVPEVQAPSLDNDEVILANRTELTEEEDSSSTVKHDGQRSDNKTPIRRSQTLKDETPEGELTRRVLRSGTKPFTAVSKQRHARHIKTVKQQGESEPPVHVMETHTGDTEGENMETVRITSVEDDENVKHDDEERGSLETEHLKAETSDDHDLKEVEFRKEDGSRTKNKVDEDQVRTEDPFSEVTKTAGETVEIAVINFDDAEGTKDAEVEGKETLQSVGEPVEEQEEGPDMVQEKEVVQTESLVEATEKEQTESEQVVENSSSTEKQADVRRSNYATPLRRSGRFKDQPLEGELTERVLRSGTKSVVSTQKHTRHTNTVKQKYESAQAVVEPEAEQKEACVESHTAEAEEKMNTVIISSVEGESKIGKEHLEIQTNDDHENQMADGSQNEPTGDGRNIAVMDIDDAVMKDAETQAEGKTTVQSVAEPAEEQEDEQALEMTQKKDGQNVVESTSGFILLKAITDENKEESKEQTEVEKQTEPAEKEPAAVSETSIGTSESQKEDRLNKADTAEKEDAYTEIGVEESMTSSLDKQVGEMGPDKTDNEQDQNMLAEEKLKDDGVGEMVEEEESTAAVTRNTAEEKREKHQKDDQEGVTSGHEGTVQDSSTEEEIPVIVSRSLRQRTVTVMSPLQRKPKRLQKTEGEMPGREHEVMVEVTDSLHKSSIEEPEENKDEKVETEDAESNKAVKAPKSTDVDQCRMEVMQGEETLKETNTPQEVPGNEEMEITEVSKVKPGDEGGKSGNWTALFLEEEDSDRADRSRGKDAASRPYYATPLRRSGRFKDQSLEGELTKMVLRSGTKPARAISKQKHIRHTETVKRREESAQAVGEPQQKEVLMQSHSGDVEEETGFTSTEDSRHLKDSTEDESGTEKKHLQAETDDDHDLKKVENKTEDGSQDEATEDGKKVTVVDINDAERETEVKTTHGSVGEPTEKQVEDPGIEMAQKEDGQEVVESISLENVAVVLVDFNKVPPKQTHDTETTGETRQNLEEADQEPDKPPGTEEEKNKEEDEEVRERESLDESAEKETTGVNETLAKTLSQEKDWANKADALQEMGAENPITEDQVVEVGVDKMLKTGTEQEESMFIDEKLKDDRAGEITLIEETSAEVAAYTAEGCTRESEKQQKEVQESVTPGHEEAVQESSLEEETPVIISRSLRKRTITVISTPQRKPKHLQVTEVKISEHEKVMEKPDKSRTEETEENKDDKIKTKNSALSSDDGIPELVVIDQSQMEVLQEVEHVKETSTPQNIPSNEESAGKELSESSLAGSDFAEVVKDAETEDEDEDKEQLSSESAEEQLEKSAIEVIPGQAEQKPEESTESLKLQKASVVLVDFSKVPPKQAAEKTLQPQEEACQELVEPADMSMDTEKSKAEDEEMKLTEAQVESAEKEQVDEGAVKITESENVVMDDAENKTAEGTSEIRDANDEKMETEEESVKEDEGRVPELMQAEEPVETLPELPHGTQTQEPAQANKEESHIQTDVEFSKKAHKADRRKRADNERSEVGTPVRRSRQLADQTMASELTTRVLRSSTKQATPKQRDTRQTKGMMQKEESEQTVDKTGEKREEIKRIHADTAEGEKGEIVITEGTTTELITAVEGRDEENNELEAEITKDNEAVIDISTQPGSEEDKAAADEVEEPTGETTDQEKATEMRVGEKTLAQPVTESVEEQVNAPVTEMAQNEDEDKAVESTSAFTIQKATVVLVDFNKVPPMQIGDSETTEETSQSQELIDNQMTIDEEREKSHKEIAEKEQTVKSKSTSVLEESEPLPEMEVEKPMTENLEEATVNMDADNSLNTGTKQEEIVLAKEKLKDDNVGDAILETESIVTVSEEMMVVSTYENQKDVEESVTPGHEETPQETLPEEETPVITSRSLRRRTVTVISTPQRKHKRVQKTEVEISEHEKVCVTETVEKIGKSSTEEKEDENKDKKMEAGNSALLHHEEAPESSIIDQSQMEVLQEVEHVKETSTPQENEKSAVKELSESSVADSDLAETVKDAHTDVEWKKQSSSKSVEEQFEGSSIEIIPGQGEQKGEEAIASLTLQKASDVLVEVPPKQTTYHGNPGETSQPQEKAHQELEEPADISMKSKAEDEGMKQTHTQTESAEKEQADKNAVTAESESVVMDDAQSKTAEGTSEIRDDQDEKMEAEEEGIPELMQEKEPVHETIAVQESPGATQVQEPLQIGKEESHIQNEEEFSDTAHKADRREQVDSERSEVGTPVRHSRRLADQPMVSELTTRVLRSSTKQVKGTPNQRDTHLTKGMMQKEVAEGEKVETVTTEGAMKGLITTLESRVKENIELEAEQIEDNQAVTDNRTQKALEQEDKVAQIKGTMDEESISGHDVSDTMKTSETGVEEKTPAQPVTEPVKEQVEAPVTEMAQNEDGDKAVKSTSAFTIQKATVLNKVPPIQTGDSETPEETSQSQEVIDNQMSIDEEREESNKEIAEQEPTVNVGADNSLNTGTEQEETVLAEEKLKDDNVGDTALEGESTATVSEEMTAACTHKNQKEVQEGITSDQETAQESSPEEETPVITSRSLRRRTVTVISTPQKKYKHVQKPGLQADTEKAEADEDTDVNKAGKTPLTCLPVEASMPEREVEDTSGNGKAISEAEEQECIMREQGIEALIVEEIPKIELERLEKLAKEGDGVREESEAKGKEEIASDTAVAADVEATTREKVKISRVKSTEVDNVGEENMDGDMTLPVQEEEISTGSPANVVVKATSHKEGMEEGEVDSTGKENNQNTSVTKPPHETTEKVVSKDEEETLITRSLRRRTITVKSPMRRKYKRQEVAEKPSDKPQSEKEAPSREDSTKLETAGPITAAEKKNEIKIKETNLKDESEKETGEEVVCLDEQEGTNTAEPDGEKVEKITGGEKDTVEGVPEDKLEERTTEDANNEKVVEVRDFVDNALEKEPDKEEEGSANPEQGDDQQEHVLDKVKEQLLMEQSEEVSRAVVEEETMSSPDKSPDEVEERVGVERRSLRKRTIAIKATIKRKSKRMCKQGQDETPEQVHVSTTEEPATEQADVMTLTEKETTHQAEQADDTENDGGAVSEKTQELGEGETNESTEKEDATHELIDVPDTNTNMEAQEGKKGEEEGENKAEADEYKGKAAEHENKNTDEGATTVGTVGDIHENQEEAELMGKNGQEGSEISLILDESFTLELEEEEENNGPQENKVVDEIKASLMECPKEASTTIRNTDNDEEESAGRGRQALRGRSQRQSKRFPTESQSEMEDSSEVEIEQEEKKKSQEKRKAIVDLTPRRSKRLARPKIV
ncbi:hypothetical protein NFI96_024569 [Prochilodus magdalenae]|nr:hypothetical protein NFI96_024569 [Prochilodus magdalenae]